MVLVLQGDPGNAMALLRQQEAMCREMNDLNALGECLGNQAVILTGRGQFPRAMDALAESERIFRDIGNQRNLASVLGNQANILAETGEAASALVRHQEAERIYRMIGMPDGLATSLGNQAWLIARYMGRPAEALPLAREAIEIAKKHGLETRAQQLAPNARWIEEAVRRGAASQSDPLQLTSLLEGPGHWQPGGSTSSAAALVQLEEYCRSTDNTDGLLHCLSERARTVRTQGYRADALVVLSEQERAAREGHRWPSLIMCLLDQASLLMEQSDADGAMERLVEAEAIAQRIDDADALQAVLGSQARVCALGGEYTAALERYAHTRAICRQHRLYTGLARALLGAAEILSGNLGNHEEALPLLNEALRVARRGHDEDLVQRAKQARAEVLSRCRPARGWKWPWQR